MTLREAAHSLYNYMNGGTCGAVSVGERDLSQWNKTKSLVVMTEKKRVRPPVPNTWESFPVEHKVVGKIRPLGCP